MELKYAQVWFLTLHEMVNWVTLGMVYQSGWPSDGMMGYRSKAICHQGILHKEFFRPVSSYFSAVERALPRNAVYPEIEYSWRNSWKNMGFTLGFYMFDTAETSQEYSSSCWAPHPWLSRCAAADLASNLAQSWRVSLVFPASVARWKTSKDQCSYEAVHMAGPKRFLLHAANHETDLTGVKLSMDVNGNIGTTESKTTISFDNLQNTPWFDNTSWMNQ